MTIYGPETADVRCVLCHARAGAPCETGGGTVAYKIHAVRRRAVEAAHYRATTGLTPPTDLAAYRARRRRRTPKVGISAPTR